MTPHRYIYHVRRTAASELGGYDMYSEFVVCAKSEMQACRTFPSIRCGIVFNEDKQDWVDERNNVYEDSGWVPGSKLDTLDVTLCGTATQDCEEGVIVASYHAG